MSQEYRKKLAKSGEVVISFEKARKAHSWNKMEKAYENKDEVKGIIISKCKGGFVVDVESCLCFLPGSQVDLRPMKNIDHLMKTQQTFECVKLDKRRGNIVLSRRAIIEKARNHDRDKIIDNLVTPRSTIALDYACFGKMPLLSCSNSISHLGFVKVPNTIEEYFLEIEKDNFSIELTKDQVLDAKIASYLLENFKNSQTNIKKKSK